METIETPVAAPANSLSEFRARKAAVTTGTPAPPADKQASAVSKDENAEASAPSPKEPQEKHQKKAQTADERAAELRAAGRVKEADKILADDAEKKEYDSWKAGKADREREAEELRQLRASRQAPPPAAAPPATPPAAAASAEPTRPKLDDYLNKDENKGKPYHEVLEEWKDADDDWKDAKRKAATESETRNKSLADKEDACRAAHPDYDQVMKGQNFVDTVARLHRDAVVAAVTELPHGTEILYRLAKDPAEVRRIAGLSQWSQVIELGVMSRAIAAETKPPEKPVNPPPVSRTPPPPRSLAGIAPNEAPPKGTPASLSEFRARKAARG